jgi:DNA-binding transcriptional regulator GbsR (MarR family)
MGDAYEKARDEFIAAMERITVSFGMPALAGRIFGLLAITPKPMSLDEISERLSSAKSGISVNIRLLENLGITRKVWVKGDRRGYYEADFRIANLYYDFFKKGMEMETIPFFDTAGKCLETLEGDVNPENVPDAELVKERLREELALKKPLLALLENYLSELKDLAVQEKGEENA